MKFSTNAIIQTVSLLVQVLNFATPIVPEKHKVIPAAIISGLQIVVSLISHYSNPDGSPATSPYYPPIKK